MKSIKLKLIIMYLALVLIVMMVSGTYIIFSLKASEIAKAQGQMQLYSEKISEQVVMSFEETQFQSGLDQFSTADSTSSQIQGNIIDLNGVTLASTSEERAPYQQYKYSVIMTAMAGEASFSTEKDDSSIEWLRAAYPVDINGEVKYIIFCQMDATEINDHLSQTATTIIFSSILALILTAFMGYFFARSLTGPIAALTSRAKEMAEGDLSHSATVYANDEIGQLTHSFNFMASELSKHIAETTKEKNRIEIILHNMTDGVISYNNHGELMLFNPVSMDMLELKEMIPTLDEFISSYDIDSSVYLDMGNDFFKTAVFPVGNKYVNASFSPYTNEKNEFAGVIVVLQDITEQKKLDDMRKEFVANVSHELRTPLTTIKSYTETLIDGAIDERDIALDFLDIINSEADRMAFLVRDLLQLSRLDNNQYTLNLSRFNLNDLINENIRQNKIHAENKHQSLNYTPFYEDVSVTADRDRVTQVVNNLLSNAIKYSPEQAKIDISVSEDSRFYKITVKDTGMGISKEDLPRIFERFYRVDKARSRAMGGTGLGLAIAKNIMESHGGTITAESEYGKGTAMTIWLPKEITETPEN